MLQKVTKNSEDELQDSNNPFLLNPKKIENEEENNEINNLLAPKSNFFKQKGLTKLAEISSNDDPNSQKKIEMYYKSPELGVQEKLNGSQYVYPEMTSIVSNEMSIHESKRKINFDLISLPDRKDYLGSWKILLKLEHDDYFQDNIEAKFLQSDRHMNRKNLKDFLENIENPSKVTSNQVIKIIATPVNESQSHGSWLYSDSSASQTMKLNVMDNKGQMIPIQNEEQKKLYEKLYHDIIDIERGEKNPEGNQFPLDYNPKEAMVVLNESFKLGESQGPEADSIDQGNMLGLGGRASQFGDKNMFPKMTRRGYTRKITKQPTMFSRGSVFNEDKDRRKSRINSQERKFSLIQGMEGRRTPTRMGKGDVSPSRVKSIKDNKSQNFSLSGNSEDMMAIESEKEDFDRVKVVVNLSREIWMSLRMAPVLSYAPQIKENIEALGFKIKFIEDLVVMNEEHKDLIQKKIDQINNASINNVRLSRFNKMGMKKLKTLDHRNLPPDQRGFMATDTSASQNTLSMEQTNDPLEMMNRFQNQDPLESFRIVSYYNVTNPHGDSKSSIRYKGVTGKGHGMGQRKKHKSGVRGKTKKKAKLFRKKKIMFYVPILPSTTSYSWKILKNQKNMQKILKTSTSSTT